MQRKFRISVEGRAYEVVVEEIGHDGSVVAQAGLHTAAPVVAAAAAVAAPAPAPRGRRRSAPATKSRRWPAPSSRST